MRKQNLAPVILKETLQCSIQKVLPILPPVSVPNIQGFSPDYILSFSLPHAFVPNTILPKICMLFRQPLTTFDGCFSFFITVYSQAGFADM